LRGYLRVFLLNEELVLRELIRFPINKYYLKVSAYVGAPHMSGGRIAKHPLRGDPRNTTATSRGV
jgi:hypothetical protein